MKRYVLTKDKTIRLATSQDERNANVDKTSDNILDFAEVGDMVEFKDDIVYLSEGILNGYKWLGIEKVGVIALWKRNGDVMRRYEV